MSGGEGRTDAEVRYDAVMGVLRDGETVTAMAARYGVSRQTFHTWLRRYNSGGLGALADRSSRPHRSPRETPAPIQAQVYELRQKNPKWGPRRLHHELSKSGVEPLPSRNGIYRILVRHNLVEPHPQRRRRQDYTRWERSRSMELWQMDVMGGIFLRTGAELKLVTGVDDHSRYCVASGVVERAMAPQVCRVFLDALGRYGTPDEVLTDNGKVFTARFSKFRAEVMFDRLCRENGIVHRLTKVKSPTTTGKIERFHKTLREELLAGRRFNSVADAQAAIDAWVLDYNTKRPHQALAMLTPADRFQRPSTVVSLTPPKAVSLDEGMVIARRIAVDGTVRVAYERYSLGVKYAGREVTVRVEPDFLHFFDKGRLLKTEARRGKKEIFQVRATKPWTKGSRTGSGGGLHRKVG